MVADMKKGLPRELDKLTEEDRVQAIFLDTAPTAGAFDLYRKLDGEGRPIFYITKHGDEKTVYAALTAEMWEVIFANE